MSALYQFVGCQIMRVADGVMIDSPDPTNEDLIAYQAWVEAGNFPDPEPSLAWKLYKNQAQQLLSDTDMTAMRCLKAGVAFPSDWLAYVAALRVIVNSATGDVTIPLPTKPSYPQNT